MSYICNTVSKRIQFSSDWFDCSTQKEIFLSLSLHNIVVFLIEVKKYNSPLDHLYDLHSFCRNKRMQSKNTGIDTGNEVK